MVQSNKLRYEFGPFCVDTRERQLLRGGTVVRLTPKVFDILLTLVQNHGRILGKDEVMKLVWTDTAVEEANLTRNISTLRKALGEKPRERQYIETIPWRGYRFVAKVKEVRDQSINSALDSVAVLPLVNASNDSEMEYLSDGITDSLINNLSQLSKLKVMSRNSVFRYKVQDLKSIPPDAQKVGQELGVQAVLTGRVVKHDDDLFMSVELIDARDNSHRWGAQYGRKLTDIFTLQETIAREIAENLHLHLTGEDQQRLRKRCTENNEAYQLYLKGRYYFNKLMPEGVQKGIEYFRRAIDEDPRYALAYTGLGDCYTYLAKPADAREAVVRALELDQTLGEAHASLGFFRFLYDWDWPEAEKQFRQAIELKPNYAEAHHWYAIYLANLGRHDEALIEAKRAQELDPLSLLMNMTPGLVLYPARRYDEAIEAFQKVIEMESNFMAAHSMLGMSYEQKRMYEKAIAEYQKVLDISGENADVKTSIMLLLARTYAACEDRKEAIKIVEGLSKESQSTSYFIAEVYAVLGEKELAFAYLDKAFKERNPQLVCVKVDPALDGLRTETSRFGDLLQRMEFDG